MTVHVCILPMPIDQPQCHIRTLLALNPRPARPPFEKQRGWPLMPGYSPPAAPGACVCSTQCQCHTALGYRPGCHARPGASAAGPCAPRNSPRARIFWGRSRGTRQCQHCGDPGIWERKGRLYSKLVIYTLLYMCVLVIYIEQAWLSIKNRLMFYCSIQRSNYCTFRSTL